MKKLTQAVINKETKTVKGSSSDLTGDEIYVSQLSKFKKLDPSIFCFLHERWRHIGIEADGCAFAYDLPVESCGNQFVHTLTGDFTDRLFIGKGFDADDWEHSLIDREDD